MLMRKMWFAFKNRPLTYISEESEKTIEMMQTEEERIQQRLIKGKQKKGKEEKETQEE